MDWRPSCAQQKSAHKNFSSLKSLRHNPGLALVFYLCTYWFFKAGIYRWWSFTVLNLLGLSAVGLWLGSALFTFWTGLPTVLFPWQLLGLGHGLPVHSALFLKLIVSLGIGLAVALDVVLFHALNKKSAAQTALGSAHFASAPEMNKAGLFNNEGIIVGKAWGKALRAGGFEHALVFSPAGSGKTTAIAVPNLLTWEHSCVVNDTKYELFELTSRFRKKTLTMKCFYGRLRGQAARPTDTTP